MSPGNYSIHNTTSDIGIYLAERSVLIRIEAQACVLQRTVGKFQRVAMDGDGYSLFSRTQWGLTFRQHPLPGVNAIKRIRGSPSRSGYRETGQSA